MRASSSDLKRAHSPERLSVNKENSNSLQEALEEPQVAALKLTQAIRHPGRENLLLMKAPIMVDGALAQLRSRPPLAGEHTAAILGELGYSGPEVAALAEARVIGVAAPSSGRDD